MNELTIRIIENKTDRRRIRILKFLYYETSQISVLDLAKHLKVDKKTLHQDLEVLKKEFHSPIQLQDNNKQLVLEGNAYDKIRDIMHLLLKETITFRLIICMVHEEYKTLQEWADYFHISYIHFRRHIQFMNSICKEFYVQIGGKTLMFMGLESDIQLFLKEYFHEIEFIKNKHIENYAYRFYKHFFEVAIELGLSPINVDYKKLETTFQIMLFRLLNAHHLEISEKTMEYNGFRPSFKTFEYIFQAVWNEQIIYLQRSISISQVEIMYCYIAILDCIDYSIASVRECVVMRPDEDFDLLLFFHDFGKKSLKKLSLSKENLIKAEMTIQAFLVNLYHVSSISILFQRRSEDLRKFIEKEHPALYDFWFEECKILTLPYNLAISFREDIAASLTMLSVPYLMDSSACNTKVYACFSGESSYVTYLNFRVKNQFLSHIDLVYLSATLITKEFIIEHNIQVLVTNFKVSIALDSLQHYLLSYIPSCNEILETIYKIEDYKLKNNNSNLLN